MEIEEQDKYIEYLVNIMREWCKNGMHPLEIAEIFDETTPISADIGEEFGYSKEEMRDLRRRIERW